MSRSFDAPMIRAALSTRSPDLVVPANGARLAAVTLLLRPAPEGAEALFVKRAEVQGDPWSGHMALPGGHRDDLDADLMDTARRETHEEVGVALDRSTFLGRLDDRHPMSRGLPTMVVSPFVAWRTERFEIQANHEVQYHYWIPLATLADPAAGSEVRRVERGRERIYPSISFSGDSIWGLTHRIVMNFLEILDRESTT